MTRTVMLWMVFAAVAHAAAPQFAAHEIATGLKGGYQVTVVDMDHDGKPDLLVVASDRDELIWFQNPGWERHVIASGVTDMINAAASEVDGDGIPESGP